MVADALAGKIDLIVTKSVSRFARNTVDSLSTVTKLKEHGTEVWFEKENIMTFDGKGELLITIMSSWRRRKAGQFQRTSPGDIASGLLMASSSFLTSDFLVTRGVRTVSQDRRTGSRDRPIDFPHVHQWQNILRHCQVADRSWYPDTRGKKIWQVATVRSILTNEKYKGEALLQKGYTVDFLTKQRQSQRGRDSSVLCEKQPPGDHRAGRVRCGPDRDRTQKETGPTK